MSGLNLNKRTIILVNVVLAQSLIVAVNGLYGCLATSVPIKISIHYITMFSVFSAFGLSAASVFLVREILRLARKETDAEIDRLNLDKSKELLTIMRAQRHDFMNHIQVIYGLAQLQKTDKLAAYIGELSYDMDTECRLGALSHSDLAVFLLQKKIGASEEGIRFDFDVYSDLRFLDISTTELVRIIGNLLDNAFYAVKERPLSESCVLLTIDEINDCYCFNIANSGQEIPANIRGNLFKQGFTTKGAGGSGLGLYIVKKLVEKNKGTVSLVEEEGFSVCFQVRLPKTK